MLQCHPYPNEYVDTSKEYPHCAFFMGLLRKVGVGGQQGQQFDIRRPVDEFKQDVSAYMFCKPGMDINVSHVHRRQLPEFVFHDGQRHSHPSKKKNQQIDRNSEGRISHGSAEGNHKRKNDQEILDLKPVKSEKRASLSPQRVRSVSPQHSVSRPGGTNPVKFSEGVKLGCSNTGDFDSIGVVRSSIKQMDKGKDTEGFAMRIGKIFDHKNALSTSIDVYDSSIVKYDEEHRAMVKVVAEQEPLDS